MWRTRYKYYLTKDPNYVITAVSTIKCFNDFEDLNKVTFMKDTECSDWIKHLENLPTRNFYEKIINDFE